MKQKNIVACVFMVAALLGLCSWPARAQIAGATLPTSSWIFTEYGGGDFVFNFATPIGDCVAGWILPTQPGAKIAIANVMAAQLASRSLNIYVFPTIVWNGSIAKTCKVYALGF